MLSRMEEVRAELKEARNFGYLGRYDDGIRLFKKMIDSIEQEIILNNIAKKDLETWRSFESALIDEKKALETIRAMLGGINPPANTSTFVSREDRPLPYPNHSINYEEIRKTNSNFRTTNRGFSASRPQQPPSLPFKDPDVWESPPKLEKRQSTQKVSKPGNPRNHQVRNLPAGKKKGEKGEGGKKTFLSERYPEGSGPDSNLIEMLEREVMDKSPDIHFDDIAELDTAKGLLQEAVLLPLKMPQFFTGIRRAWKGVLLFGPPGTGKTLLAKAVASNGGTTFFNVSASSLASKWKGESQKLVRILFEMAKFYSPSVIFFDEIDALGGRRKEGEDESNRKVKTELLVQMDGATSSTNEEAKFVIVLAATNRPWDLDEALRRRLEKRIYIPLPTEKGRRELLKIHLKNVRLDETIDFEFIVKKTEGFSGADITNVCREAAYMPMRRKLKDQGGFKNIVDLKKFEEEVSVPLKKEDFLEALKSVNKSVGKDDLHKYDAWMKEFGTI